MSAQVISMEPSAEVPLSRHRVRWVDTLRGICIILVVHYHMPGGWGENPYISLFLMPLFFVLSGYLFKTAVHSSFLSKRVRTLLVPYLSFCVAVLLIDYALSFVSHVPPGFAGEPVWKIAIRVLIGSWALYGPVGALWFLPTLFCALVLYNVLYRWSGNSLGLKMICAMVVLCMLQYAVHVLMQGENRIAFLLSRVPHSAPVLPAAIVFVWVGNAVKEHAVLRSPPVVAFAVCTGLLLSLFAEPVNMKMIVFGNPLVAVPAAVGLVAIMALASALIARLPGLHALFSLAGNASITVLGLHGLFLSHLRGVLPLLALFLVAAAGPVLVHVVLSRWNWSRTLFLGGRMPVAPRVQEVPVR